MPNFDLSTVTAGTGAPLATPAAGDTLFGQQGAGLRRFDAFAAASQTLAAHVAAADPHAAYMNAARLATALAALAVPNVADGAAAVGQLYEDTGTGLLSYRTRAGVRVRVTTTAAVVPFSPEQLAGYLVALRPGLATCFTDAAGTVAAAVGDPVWTVRDPLLSGTPIVFTQATSGQRPTLRLVSGKYVLRMTYAATSGMLCNVAVPGGSRCLGLAISSAAAAGTRAIQGVTSNTLVSPRRTSGLCAYAGGEISGYVHPDALPMVAVLTHAAGGAWAYTVNGANQNFTAGAVATTPQTADWVGLALGAAGSTPSESSDCDIYGATVSAGLTGTPLADLGAWLAALYT